MTVCQQRLAKTYTRAEISPATSYSLVIQQAVTRGVLTKRVIPTLLLTGTSGSGLFVVVVLWLPACVVHVEMQNGCSGIRTPPPFECLRLQYMKSKQVPSGTYSSVGRRIGSDAGCLFLDIYGHAHVIDNGHCGFPRPATFKIAKWRPFDKPNEERTP